MFASGYCHFRSEGSSLFARKLISDCFLSASYTLGNYTTVLTQQVFEKPYTAVSHTESTVSHFLQNSVTFSSFRASDSSMFFFTMPAVFSLFLLFLLQNLIARPHKSRCCIQEEIPFPFQHHSIPLGPHFSLSGFLSAHKYVH